SAHPARDVEARHVREVGFNHHDVWPQVADQLERHRAVRRGDDREAALFENRRDGPLRRDGGQQDGERLRAGRLHACYKSNNRATMAERGWRTDEGVIARLTPARASCEYGLTPTSKAHLYSACSNLRHRDRRATRPNEPPRLSRSR